MRALLQPPITAEVKHPDPPPVLVTIPMQYAVEISAWLLEAYNAPAPVRALRDVLADNLMHAEP